MQLKELEFYAPAIEAIRRLALKPKPTPLQLDKMTRIHDTATAQRPRRTGQTYAEFLLYQTRRGSYRSVVKPGQTITNYFPPTNEALTEKQVHSGLGQKRGSSYNEKISDAISSYCPFEQYTRDRLGNLLANDVGLGKMFAPILPVKDKRHGSFLLAASVYMGSGNNIVDLTIDGQDDYRHWESDYSALNVFVPLLRDYPKLWSLMCANFPFRAFISDPDHNPGAYVLTHDGNGNISPYGVDCGRAFYLINDSSRAFSDALKTSRIIEKCIHKDYVVHGAPERADMDVILEVTENIYCLSSKSIRERVMMVEESVPHFVLNGDIPTVEHVCAKLEKSRRELARIFNDWYPQMNAISGLPLFTKIPDMSGTHFQVACQLPEQPSNRTRRTCAPVPKAE